MNYTQNGLIHEIKCTLQEILSPDTLGAMTRLVLVNTVYFKGVGVRITRMSLHAFYGTTHRYKFNICTLSCDLLMIDLCSRSQLVGPNVYIMFRSILKKVSEQPHSSQAFCFRTIYSYTRNLCEHYPVFHRQMGAAFREKRH